MMARRGGFMEGAGRSGVVTVRSLVVRVETMGPGAETGWEGGESSAREPIVIVIVVIGMRGVALIYLFQCVYI